MGSYRHAYFDLASIRSLVTGVILVQALAFISIAPPWLFICLALFALVLFFTKLAESGVLKASLIVGSVGSFAVSYGAQFTVETAGIFLLLVASMKAIELKARRDALVFTYAMFYLSAISMLFEQGILHVVLQLSAIVLCFSILMRLNDATFNGVRSQFLRVSKLVVLAVPLAVCLFLFFPRFSPLWSLPIQTSNAKTGMSDTLTPGSIAELSQSAERAFRVSFNGEMPSQNALYWRALSMDQFDGRTWSRASSPLNSERASAGLLSNRRYDKHEPIAVDGDYYDVIVEPHNNRWAFATAGSTPSSGNVYLLGGGSYEFRQDVVSPTPYRMARRDMKALLGLPTAVLLKGVDRVASLETQDLQLPSSGNARSREFVNQLLKAGPTELEFIASILRYFRDEQFVYTLRPPTLENDSVDQFLFDTRRGFCEHYASSTAFLLREAGIPARVVAGYQGGEYNDNLGYLVVRQYDAHAWVEAKVQGLGWVRIDPTAYVAPNRVEQNLEEAMREEGSFLEKNPYAALSRSIAALNWLSSKADEVNYRWQRFVLGYGEQDQRAMFERVFGRFDMRILLWVLVSLVFLVATLIALYLWLGRYSRTLSLDERRYLRFVMVLRVFKVERAIGETPEKFLLRSRAELNPWVYRILEKRTRHLNKTLYNIQRD